MMTLANLKPKQKALIVSLPNDHALCSRLLEQGFIPNSDIHMAHKSWFNGLLAIQLAETKVAISKTIAGQIEIELV